MRDKLRIALVTGSVSHRGYGVRNAVELLSADLARLGHDVVVFGLRDPDWEAKDRKAWRGAEVHALPFYGPENFGFAPGLSREILAFSPDIVHINGLWMYSSVVAPRVARQSQAKVVISPHGMLADVALNYAPLKKRVAMSLFQRRCFKAADGFHATAGAEMAEIRAAIPDARVCVIPNGLRVSGHEILAMSDRENVVISIGRLHHVKGYDLLLEAWRDVEVSFPDWRLEIYGPSTDGYGHHLSALAQKLGLVNVTINDAIDEGERDRRLSMSKLFVLSSRNENFALTVPEALQFGTPVLATTGTPWAGLRENACGWWVENNSEGLSRGLRQALAIDDAKREAMGKRGRSWVKQEFSSESVAEDMTKFYSALIESNDSSLISPMPADSTGISGAKS